MLSLSFLFGKQPLDPLLHFPRRFIRKGDGQNIFWIDMVGQDQIGNSVGEGASFARSSACHNQERSTKMLDGLPLRRVEVAKKINLRHGHTVPSHPLVKRTVFDGI